jgi:hypothetical protein
MTMATLTEWERFVAKVKARGNENISIVQPPPLPAPDVNPLSPEHGWITFPLGRHGDVLDVLQCQNILIARLLVEQRKRKG